MKNHVCPKCESEAIQKGVVAATVGQVYMYPTITDSISSKHTNTFLIFG